MPQPIPTPTPPLMPLEDVAIAVIGVGRSGLPLAVALGRRYDTIGYDKKRERIEELRRAHDRYGELDAESLRAARRLRFATRLFDLRACNVYVVTVGSSEDRTGRPDTTAVSVVCKSVGSMLKSGDVVIFETGIYPGGTEQVCIPLLERVSNLRCGRDFHVGYSTRSPDVHGQQVAKAVAGSSPAATEFIAALYGAAMPAGVQAAGGIRVVEAAHVVNQVLHEISLAAVNELTLIFNRLGVDANAAISAAEVAFHPQIPRPGTAACWNLGIDPFVLPADGTRGEYQHDLLATARRLNRRMGSVIARQLTRLMNRRGQVILGTRVLLLGITARPESSDLHGSLAFDVMDELRREGMAIDVMDPHAIPADLKRDYGLDLVTDPEPGSYDAVVLLVPHAEFAAAGGATIAAYAKPGAALFDARHALDPSHTHTAFA